MGDWRAKYGDALEVLSPEDLERRLETMRRSAPDSDNIWVFAYGSLLWNPAIEFVETRVGTLYGFHRSFCLRSVVSRGSPCAPGLMLGLLPGGSCRSPAYRIARDEVDTELPLLFRREMMTSVYRPRWVRLHSGADSWPALAFVMDRRHPMYTGVLSPDETARIISTAEGTEGPCREYLFRTIESLGENRIRDPYLESLAHRVGTATLR